MDVDDYIAAGETQRRLQHLFDGFRSEYQTATLRISERRVSKPRRAPGVPLRVVRSSGALNRYEEVG